MMHVLIFFQTIQPKPDKKNYFTHKHTKGAQKNGGVQQSRSSLTTAPSNSCHVM